MKHVRGEPRLREVTSEQLKEGYLVLDGVVARRHEYIVHHKASHQTFAVYDPESISGWDADELPKVSLKRKEPEFEEPE